MHSLLENHLQQRLTVHSWIHPIIEDPKAFPFELADTPTACALVDQSNTISAKQQTFPVKTQSTHPFYVVNIPYGHSYLETDPVKLVRLVERIRDESFGKTDVLSKRHSIQRQTVVIGVNQPHSLDRERDETLKTFLDNLPKIEGITYRVFGFFWIPSWNPSSKNPVLSKKKTYRYIRIIAPSIAKKIVEHFEGKTSLTKNLRAQIPYQMIRERILRSDYTQTFMRLIARNYPSYPLYLTIMDADTLCLRQGTGVFSKADTAIKEHSPAVLSLGYTFAERERPILRLGVEIDMAIREAMNRVIPYSAYFPEPGTFIIAKRPNSPLRSQNLSFSGKGSAMETRRIIENGRKSLQLDHRAVFLNQEGILTTTPERMFTKNIRETKVWNVPILVKEETLKATRAVRQSHAFPKRWAESVYAAAPFSPRKMTDLTKPLMDLLSLYDPFPRLYVMNKKNPYTPQKNFKRMLQEYTPTIRNQDQEHFEEIRRKFESLGISENWVQLFTEAAKASGKAIHSVLQQEYEQLNTP